MMNCIKPLLAVSTGSGNSLAVLTLTGRHPCHGASPQHHSLPLLTHLSSPPPQTQLSVTQAEAGVNSGGLKDMLKAVKHPASSKEACMPLNR